jgi:hypothetical protein
VYLAQQETFEHSLIALYIVIEGQGALIKLGGTVALDPNTGQITATFDNNPQLPFSELRLKFFPGPRAPLVTPSTCGTYAATSQLTPWSSSTPFEPVANSFSIESGCAHAFAPSFTAGTTNLQAGGYTPFSLTLKGECSEAALLGESTASAGPGEDPFWVKGGRVYLTGPYGGAPFGLSIVVPAVAGPFNLGNVIARSGISVDPHTAQAIITTALPTIKDGIPLDVRTVNVTIKRPGFIFNPTSCTPSAVGGTVGSTAGASATVSSPFDVANCAALPFAPRLTASVGAHASKSNGTSFRVKLESAGIGQANIHKVDLQLPSELPSRLSTLQKACLAAVFEANPAGCGAESVIGNATIRTPLLAAPLTGPAYLVSHGGAAFPDVEFVLQGEGVTLILDGQTQIKNGITYSRFETAPDAPFTSFETELPAGPHSILGAYVPKTPYNLCASSLQMPTEITGQNGAVIRQSTSITPTGSCPPKITVLKHTVRGHTATIAVGVPSAGTLAASATGLSKTAKKTNGAGTVTVRLTLSHGQVAFLKRHRGRRIVVHVHLTFTPRHGSRLTATTTVLIG